MDIPAIIGRQAEGGCSVLLFPLSRRMAAVRAAAERIGAIRRRSDADRCRARIAGRFFGELTALGLVEEQQDEAVGAFFLEVERELARRGRPDVVSGLW